MPPVLAAMIGHQAAIEPVIRIAEKNLRPPVAALGHMVRKMWKDDPGEAGHVMRLNGIDG
jgi:hypothetical protein